MTLSDEFLAKGREMGERLGLSFTQLLFVMNHESGLNPAAQNPSGMATGLIQFMPATLERWGMTPSDMQSLSAEGQLPYVERFLRPYASKKLSSVGRIHQALFVPASLDVATGPDDVIAEEGGTRYNGAEGGIYNANKHAFDRRGDGYISARKMEERDFEVAKQSSTLLNALVRLKELHPEDFRMPAVFIAMQVALGGALAGGAYWFFFKRRRAA